METKKQLFITQMIITGLIFLLFLSGMFFTIKFLPYLLIPLIIANIVFLFINHTKGLFVNIKLIILSLLLFIFLIEIIATLLGIVLSLFQLIRILRAYFKKFGEPQEVKAKPKKKVKKKK